MVVLIYGKPATVQDPPLLHFSGGMNQAWWDGGWGIGVGVLTSLKIAWRVTGKAETRPKVS